MLSPETALAGALRRAPAAALLRRRALVIGGGGTLGAAVLEALLARHGFEAVGVMLAAPMRLALRGLQGVADNDAALRAFAPDTALIVFDRERHANGRDLSFLRPEPAALVAQAQALMQAGATSLIVVVPHAPSLLPQALKQGLANLDEGAVAAMGYTQLVFMRMAQAGGAPAAARVSAPQRLAAWMLSQLRWMVPQREQPVRSDTVARVAAALALALPQAAPGTRVLPPELLWQAAQSPQAPAADDLIVAWLGGGMVSPVGRA
jgi:hypothetical protein